MFSTIRLSRVARVALLLAVVTLCAQAQTVPLEGGWSFLPDRDGKLTAQNLPAATDAAWRAVRVGVSWNAQFEDLRDYMGVAWYRTSFTAPQFGEARTTLLRFAAVDYIAEVFVNGQPAFTHEGGYTPFVVDASKLVKPGRNEVLVRVTDPPMEQGEKLSLYDQIPHGKQNWYVQTGGIWQPVWVEFRPATYISKVHVDTQVDGTLEARIHLAGQPQEGNLYTVTVLDPSGRAVLRHEDRVSGQALSVKGRVNEPQLWGFGKPNLYTIEVALGADRATDRFGFRSFEARDGKFYLNGEPFYMRSALDQDFYPDTIYTPPSKTYVLDMMLKAKALGLNLLRCHIKVCDAQYLDAADELGMLVWYEVPSWNDRNRGNVFSPAAAERGEKVFRDMMDRDWNRPSIVITSVINESWGADLRNADQREWLKAAFNRAKKLLGNRALVVDNSACCDNFHVKSDIDDFHQYYSIPDNAHRWNEWVADFASRPKWSYSQHGDAERTGKEPLLVSEFGNWGLPQLPKQLPWWFDRAFGDRDVTRPAGVLDRFKSYQFTRLFPDFNQLALATQWHQYRSLKHEIEEMRRYSSIQGYVITELTDINWEVNGLMDMWRNPKAYATRLAEIQQDDVVMLRPAKRSFTAGERVRAEVLLSAYSNVDWKGAEVRWSAQSGANGRYTLKTSVPRAAATALQPIEFTAGTTTQPRIERLQVEVVSPDGTLLARNDIELYLFPAARRAAGSVTVHDPGKSLGDLATALRTRGYTVGASKSALMISSAWDATVESHLRNGGRALVLLNTKDAAVGNAPFKLAARAGSDLDGNWVTNFNWVLPEAAPFKGVALRPLLGFEAAAVAPEFILQGVAPEQYGNVLAGIFYGWLNNNAALAMRVQSGSGAAVATTFRFQQYSSDPFARMLLDSMIAYAAAPQAKAAGSGN